MTLVRTLAELDSIYGAPAQTSITKEIDHLTEQHRAYVEASPFVLVATSGPGGLDCSPRCCWQTVAATIGSTRSAT